MGATNIEEYIPKNCFIDYNQFKNIEELYLYLKNMDDEEYTKFRNDIKKFISTTDEIAVFSAKEWVNSLEVILKAVNESDKFYVSYLEKIKIDLEYAILSIKLFFYKLKNRRIIK